MSVVPEIASVAWTNWFYASGLWITIWATVITVNLGRKTGHALAWGAATVMINVVIGFFLIISMPIALLLALALMVTFNAPQILYLALRTAPTPKPIAESALPPLSTSHYSTTTTNPETALTATLDDLIEAMQTGKSMDALVSELSAQGYDIDGLIEIVRERYGDAQARDLDQWLLDNMK